mgnify:CR=1 FL=1
MHVMMRSAIEDGGEGVKATDPRTEHLEGVSRTATGEFVHYGWKMHIILLAHPIPAPEARGAADGCGRGK